MIENLFPSFFYSFSSNSYCRFSVFMTRNDQSFPIINFIGKVLPALIDSFSAFYSLLKHRYVRFSFADFFLSVFFLGRNFRSFLFNLLTAPQRHQRDIKWFPSSICKSEMAIIKPKLKEMFYQEKKNHFYFMAWFSHQKKRVFCIFSDLPFAISCYLLFKNIFL